MIENVIEVRTQIRGGGRVEMHLRLGNQTKIVTLHPRVDENVKIVLMHLRVIARKLRREEHAEVKLAMNHRPEGP